MRMKRLACLVAVTVIVTVACPEVGVVGTPVTVPLLLIDRPAGRPDALQLYGLVPPLTVRVVAVYGVPALPSGSTLGALIDGRAFTVST